MASLISRSAIQSLTRRRLRHHRPLLEPKRPRLACRGGALRRQRHPFPGPDFDHLNVATHDPYLLDTISAHKIETGYYYPLTEYVAFRDRRVRRGGGWRLSQRPGPERVLPAAYQLAESRLGDGQHLPPGLNVDAWRLRTAPHRRPRRGHCRRSQRGKPARRRVHRYALPRRELREQRKGIRHREGHGLVVSPAGRRRGAGGRTACRRAFRPRFRILRRARARTGIRFGRGNLERRGRSPLTNQTRRILDRRLAARLAARRSLAALRHARRGAAGKRPARLGRSARDGRRPLARGRGRARRSDGRRKRQLVRRYRRLPHHARQCARRADEAAASGEGILELLAPRGGEQPGTAVRHQYPVAGISVGLENLARRSESRSDRAAELSVHSRRAR